MSSNKSKQSISELTNGKYFSMQEVSKQLKVPRNEIYAAAKLLELEVTVLFHKYAIYTPQQVSVLKHFLNGTHLESLSTRKGEFR